MNLTDPNATLEVTPGMEFVRFMTVRAHFAGLAMQGIIASYSAMTPPRKQTARQAVQFADALLAALEEPKLERGEPDKPKYPDEETPP